MKVIIESKGITKEYNLDSFGKDVVSFGRSAECDIVIEEQYVSRLHGCFYKENGSWHIKDLDSSHGIIKNGKRINSSPLADGKIYNIQNKNSQSNIISIRVSSSGEGIENNKKNIIDDGISEPKTIKNDVQKDFEMNNSGNGNSNAPIIIGLVSCVALVIVVVLAVIGVRGTRAKTDETEGTSIATTEVESGEGIDDDGDSDDESAHVNSEGIPADEYVYSEDNPVDEVYELTEDRISFDEEDWGFVNDIILIFFTDDASEKDKIEIVKSIDGRIAGQFDTLNQIQVLVRKADREELQKTCDSLKTNKYVENAMIDDVFEIDFAEYKTPSDPYYSHGVSFGKYSDEAFTKFLNDDLDKNGNIIWDENNPAGSNWYCEAIEARGAWQYEGELEKVQVGMLDTALDADHEDLSGKVKYLRNSDKVKDSYGYDEEKSHGTHVAGVIAACENNIGIKGVAPNADIIYTDSMNNNLVTKARFIKYYCTSGIVENTEKLIKSSGGKMVVNISAATNRPTIDLVLDAQAYYFSKMISRELDKGKDFVIVQTAGNDGVDAVNAGLFSAITSKNCYTKKHTAEEILGRIIIVGAAGYKKDSSGNYYMADFSNWGKQVSIYSPGVQIYSSVHPYSDWDHYYEFKSGTCMAAPSVTATCALVWGVAPDLSGKEVKDIVCANENTKYGVVYNPDNSKTKNKKETYRLVDAKLSVEAALKKAGKEKLIVSESDDEKDYDEGGRMLYTYVVASEKTTYGSGEVYETNAGNDVSSGIYHDIEVPRIGNLRHPEFRFLYPGLDKGHGSMYLYNLAFELPVTLKRIEYQDGYDEYYFGENRHVTRVDTYNTGDGDPVISTSSSYDIDLANRKIVETTKNYLYMGGADEPADYNTLTNTFYYGEFGNLGSVIGDDYNNHYYYEEDGDLYGDYYYFRVNGYDYVDSSGQEYSGTITYEDSYDNDTNTGWIYVSGTGLYGGCEMVDIYMENGFCKTIEMYSFSESGTRMTIEYEYERVKVD